MPGSSTTRPLNSAYDVKMTGRFLCLLFPPLQDIDEGDDGRRSSRIYDYYMLYSKWKKLRADRQRQGQEPAAPRSGAPQRK